MKKNNIVHFFGAIILMSFCLSIHAVKIENITLSDTEEEYMKSLIRSLKFHTNELCNLCTSKENTSFKNQTDRDYEYKLENLKKGALAVIDTIGEFYSIIGLDEHQIKQKKAELINGLCCY